jgi:hypothetical protein
MCIYMYIYIYEHIYIFIYHRARDRTPKYPKTGVPKPKTNYKTMNKILNDKNIGFSDNFISSWSYEKVRKYTHIYICIYTYMMYII